MTVYLNVTDAVGIASNHGITRVERKIAAHVLPSGSCEPIVIHRGELWRIDTADVLPRLTPADARTVPVVERFGVDAAVMRPGRFDAPRAALSRRLSHDHEPATGPTLRPLSTSADDVIASMGLDWQRGFLDAVERHRYGRGARYAGFCYDTIPIDHPEWLFPADPDGFARHLRRTARLASTMICISERTRADVARHLPAYPADRMPVLTLGADAALVADGPGSALVADLFDGEPYAIYCATLDRRKNHAVLYRAMRELVRRGSPGNLVFVGMLGSGVDDLVDAMRTDPLVRGRIVHVTRCDDHALAACYAGARFAVYPSLYEGWGLGVTEAMAHRKPCIVASGSSLGEASFGTAPVVHPLATADWADAMAAWFATEPPMVERAVPTWADAAGQWLEMVRS